MLKLLISLLAGAVSVLAFAPFGWWPLMLPSLACFFVLLYRADDRRQSVLLGYCYGLGLFGAGVYWIYYSLHLFGAAIAPLAAVGTFLFVAALAIYPALFALILTRFARKPVLWFLLSAPSVWLLVEWFRSWFLTGFPWLSIGYTTIHTPLAGFAPIGGVYLNSLLLAMLCGAMGLLLVDRSRGSLLSAGTVAVSILLGGTALKQISWSAPATKPVSVTMVQGNIAQELKFQPNLIEDSLRIYAEMSRTGSELVIWPESAIPTFFSDVSLWEEEFARRMAENGSVVLSGGFYANADFSEFYNAIKLLGGSEDQLYAKKHLVPFGEFLPFRGLLSVLEGFIEIPMSDLSPRDWAARPMEIGGVKYSLSICYEDAFGAEMLEQAADANVLINISNDGWFGDSTAPHQHQEIAAMRSLEFQRPMLRATNTGISSVISHNGIVLHSSEQFVADHLDIEVVPRSGATLFSRVGNYLVLLIACVLFFTGIRARTAG